LLGWKADAFQLRLSMLFERITMVVVRSYFSGSLCCPMLKGFTVNRSCSTCTTKTIRGKHVLSITILKLYYIIVEYIIIYLLCVHNPAVLNSMCFYILQRCADASRDDSAAPCCKASLQTDPAAAAAKKAAWKFDF